MFRGQLKLLSVLFAAAWILASDVDATLADSLLQVHNGSLCSPGKRDLPKPGFFDLRGIELVDWPTLARPNSDYVRGTLQPIAYHGLNTVGISLQGDSGAGRFFSPDGRSVDEAAGAAFKDFAFRTRDHGFALIVGLFSPDRKCWLGSADAYREAVQAVVRLLPAKHSCVLVMGDPFGGTSWDPACPYAMQDPQALLQLCRDAKMSRTDALLAIPSSAIESAQALTTETPWLYIGQEPEDLRAALGVESPDAAKFATVRAGCFLLHKPADPAFNRMLNEFASRVEQERLQEERPAVPSSQPALEQVLRSEEKAAGFSLLFDGRTLDGWTTLGPDWGGWSIGEGCIRCAGTAGPWLRTTRRYRSFKLRLEYRIEANGNSGVFIHAPFDGRASRFGMEIQIFGANREQPGNDTSGAIYAVLPPRRDASRQPGQWNALEITSRGSRVTVRLNDQLVQDVDTATEPALKGRLTEGCIGLQDHGNPVWFRNIRIKALPDAPPASAPASHPASH